MLILGKLIITSCTLIGIIRSVKDLNPASSLKKLFLSMGRSREVPLSNIGHVIHDRIIYLASCCNDNITTRITRWRIHILCGFKRVHIYWFYKITCANCSFAAHDHTESYSRCCPSNCQFQLQLKEAHGYSNSKP